MSPRPIVPPTPMVEGRDLICPNCGGEITCRSDAMHYGVTVEQCVNVLRCGYWKHLTRITIPAHTTPPRGEERPRRLPGTIPMTKTSNGRLYPQQIAGKNELRELVLQGTPAPTEDPMTARQIADRIGRPAAIVCTRLCQLVHEGVIVRIHVDGSRFVRWRRAH